MNKLRFILLFGILVMAFSCSDESEVQSLDDDLEIVKRQDEIPGYNFLGPCDAQNITVFVDDNCNGSQYELAVLVAIQKFNATPTALNLTVIDNQAAADIVIDCVNGDTCGEGVTSFPGGALNVGNADIELEIDWENCPCTDDTDCSFVDGEPTCMFVRTAMHEIAHALGFHHNGEGTWIPGTPNTGFDDPNSVFNSGPVTAANCDWCDAPCEFNAGDLMALRLMYPWAFIEGDFDICEGQTFTYCIDHPGNVGIQWTSPVNSTSNCIEVTPSETGEILLSVDINDNGCEYTLERTITVHQDAPCAAPQSPPLQFSEICLGDFRSVCYDFGAWDCFESITTVSSNRKLLVNIQDGRMCLDYIWTREATIELEVTFEKWCGGSETVTWIINVVDCDEPVISDPPQDDPPSGGGPTADDCSDFLNPCPCDTVADCPPGWKCIGGAGNKICIEM